MPAVCSRTKELFVLRKKPGKKRRKVKGRKKESRKRREEKSREFLLLFYFIHTIYKYIFARIKAGAPHGVVMVVEGQEFDIGASPVVAGRRQETPDSETPHTTRAGEYSLKELGKNQKKCVLNFVFHPAAGRYTQRVRYIP